MTLYGVFALMTTLPTLAYVGPGPGLSMIGVLIGLVLTLFAALWAVLQWPLRVLLRRRREQRDAAQTDG